jgi:hypothetical protein
MCLVFMVNYFLVGVFLMTDFMNLKIKSGQSFEGACRNRVYIHVFIGVSHRMCMSICICTVFLKKVAT